MGENAEMKQLLLVALAIATPAVSQPAGPPTGEQRNALQTYFTCLYQAAHERDDGVVDPAVLARKIAPGCRSQLGEAASVFSAGKPQAERDELYKKWLALENRQVIKVVVTQRQDRLIAGISATATPATKPATPAQPEKPQRTATKPAVATPKKAKAKPVPATTAANAKPMSEWRRAYIAKHGHAPPVAAK
jgi:hypothetical protein